MSYEAVIFDFDGVLIDSGFDGFQWAVDARQEYIEQADIDVDKSKIRHGVYVPEDKKLSDIVNGSSISWKQFKKMEDYAAERKLELASTGELQLFDDVRPVLETLDLPIAIVSNSYREYLEAIFKEMSIGEYVMFYNAPSIENIQSFTERMKPEPVMINEALDTLGTRKAVMIGDQIEDVMGANRAGIDSIYIDRNGGVEEKADHSVESLKEALEIIQD